MLRQLDPGHPATAAARRVAARARRGTVMWQRDPGHPATAAAGPAAAHAPPETVMRQRDPGHPASAPAGPAAAHAPPETVMRQRDPGDPATAPASPVAAHAWVAPITAAGRRPGSGAVGRRPRVDGTATVAVLEARMSLAAAQTGTCAVSHRGRTSSVRAGSATGAVRMLGSERVGQRGADRATTPRSGRDGLPAPGTASAARGPSRRTRRSPAPDAPVRPSSHPQTPTPGTWRRRSDPSCAR